MQYIVNAFHSTLYNIKSNKQVFFVSIATVTIAMSILGLFLVVFVNLNAIVTTWSKQVQLIVYLDDNIVKGEKEALEKEFALNPDVDSFFHVTRDEAWSKFKTSFGGKSGLVSKLDFNPLPATYNVKFKEGVDRLDKIREFAERLKGKAGVESLEYGEKWISRFEKFMLILRVFLLAVGALLGTGLILIISNTIKLSIYSRQDEIELMLLIGATYRYIKIPLLVEGILQGLTGSLVALGMTKLIHIILKLQFENSVENIFREVSIQFLSMPFVLGLITLGAFIGWVGSYIAITPFLNQGIRK